jgi:protein-S-isoprenylcysteine O-methyltransferase Ste14
MKKILKWLLSGLYGLVMIEIVVMISPFAFYWYSLYAPTLQKLYRWRATAWLEAFFLPHSVITTSPALEFLRWKVGPACLSLGIIGFLVCAAQIYGSKLRHRGVVHSWIYTRIRHPQYVFLAIAGLGLLTMWPRIIILVLYTGMLFFYYFLARLEEKQMAAKNADYAEYRQRTAMFFPGNPGRRLYRIFFGWIPNRSAALIASSVVMTLLVIGSGLFLRYYTVVHTAKQLLPEYRILGIAIWPIPNDKIQQVVSVALDDRSVRLALDNERGAVFTAHILPANYGMVDMFADVGTDHCMFTRLSPYRFKFLGGLVFPFLRPHGSKSVMGTPQENYTVIFSRVDGPDRSPGPLSSITGLEAKMTPVIIANIDGVRCTLQKVVIPPRRSLWGDITMPMF